MPVRPRRLVAIALFVLAVAVICFRAECGRRYVRERGEIWDAKYPPVTEWSPPPGFSHFADLDGNYWHLYALEMANTCRWRVRHVDYDNPPMGREMHWSSSYSWWLISLSWMRTQIRGGSLVENLPWASDYGEAILHGVVLALFAGIMWGRAGGIPAALAALLYASLESLARDFAFARPDHHGMQDAVMLLFTACIMRGLWPGERRARLWMMAAGAFSGAALWLGASFGLFPLAAAALGGMLYAWLRRGGVEPRETATLWRWWGCTGAVVALIFYAIEYAPGPWPFRLETNHPLYAIALAGLGELAARAQGLRESWRAILRPGFILAAVAVVQLPVTILLLPVSLYTPRDPVIVGLVAMGVESMPILFASGSEQLCYFGSVALLIVALAALWWRWREGKTEAWQGPVVAVAILACMLGGAMVRAAGLAAGGAVLAWAVMRSAGMPRWLRVAEVLALAVAFAGPVWLLNSSRAVEQSFTTVEADWQVVRDVALLLREDGGKPPCLMTDNMNANHVFFSTIAGGRIVGAQFWECVDGLRDTRDFWLAQDDATAMDICRRRGVTHVILKATPGVIVSQFLAGQLNPESASAKNLMIARLSYPEPRPPQWLKRMPLPATHALLGDKIRLYRVELPPEN